MSELEAWTRESASGGVLPNAAPDRNPTTERGVTMVASQTEKAERFRALHARPGAFIIPNPWDIGTARAAERVRAAVAAARALPFVFTLTARAENYLHGRPDLRDTIIRLQAYQEAGADVLYAPGLKSKDEIAAVVKSLDRPVNVVMGLQGVQLSLAELSEIGIKRVSVGSALCRAALGSFLRAAREMRERGTFAFASEAVRPSEIGAIFNQIPSEK